MVKRFNEKERDSWEGHTDVKKIGIFGGSFNPPHVGHLMLADRVCEEFALDTMYFVPAGIPPHKIGAPHLAANTDRLAMLNFSIAGNPKFAVSSVEMERAGVSYTAITLEQFRSMHPGEALYFLMGSDSLAEFDTWNKPERILSLAQLIVVPRPHHGQTDVPREYAERVLIAHTPLFELSSTDIRERVRLRKSIRYCVRREVEEYIMNRRLYRQ